MVDCCVVIDVTYTLEPRGLFDCLEPIGVGLLFDSRLKTGVLSGMAFESELKSSMASYSCWSRSWFMSSSLLLLACIDICC